MKRQLFRLLRWLQSQCDNHPEAPTWHTPQELFEYLRGHSSDALADRLAAEYASNLQRSFANGWSMGYRASVFDCEGEAITREIDRLKYEVKRCESENEDLRQRLRALG